MTNIDKIFIRLSHLVKMDSKEDIAEFERIIWDLAATNDPIIISKLISLFDDNCRHPEVMYSLVHAIEQCEVNKYVTIILEVLPVAIKKSPMWVETIFNRTLNDQVSREILLHQINHANKESLLKLFDLMEKESSHHREIIAELRAELEKKK